MDRHVIDAALERHRHILDGTWESAGRFTQRVCWDLRSEFALIRKDGGRNCGGPAFTRIDCDKVIDRRTFEVFDVVVSAGSPGNVKAWNREGQFPDLAGRMLDPVPYDELPVPEPGPSPTPEPPPGPSPAPAPCQYQPTDLSALQARIDRLVESNQYLGDRLAAIEDALNTHTREWLDFQSALTGTVDEQGRRFGGLELDASNRLLGRISGTIRLPREPEL